MPTWQDDLCTMLIEKARVRLGSSYSTGPAGKPAKAVTKPRADCPEILMRPEEVEESNTFELIYLLLAAQALLDHLSVHLYISKTLWSVLQNRSLTASAILLA